MVIVRLYGGLGNQLFQYAAGRAIAQRNGATLGLDIADFARDPKRSYRLHNLNTRGLIVPRRVSVCLRDPSLRRLVRCAPFFARHQLLPVRHEYLIEPHFNFDPRLQAATGNVCLDGYWQSERYFSEVAPLLRQEFSARNAPDPTNEAMGRLIGDSESVSVHVRRGDYVSEAHTNRYHGTCTLDYYRRAIETLCQEVERPHFFLFSDDMDWTSQHLRLDFPATYVTHNGVDREHEDLRLMSQCKHHIIANSSFSWWGAWLATNSGKIVIAPARWFDEAPLDTRDLLPPSWRRM
jgi:hypothetical protein